MTKENLKPPQNAHTEAICVDEVTREILTGIEKMTPKQREELLRRWKALSVQRAQKKQ